MKVNEVISAAPPWTKRTSVSISKDIDKFCLILDLLKKHNKKIDKNLRAKIQEFIEEEVEKWLSFNILRSTHTRISTTEIQEKLEILRSKLS